MASPAQASGIGLAAAAGAAGPGAAAPFPLTEALLVEVLRHVGDQRELLGHCALVSSAWRSASAAACSSLELELAESAHGAAQACADGLCAWLVHSGGSVAQLQLSGHWTVGLDRPQLELSLPLRLVPRLQQLSVESCKLLSEQPPAASDSSSSPNLAALTSLRLRNVQLHWRGGLAAPLAACTGLRKLELWAVTVHSAASSLGEQLCSVLQRQPQLTQLALHHVRDAAQQQGITDAALAPSLGGLTQLRELQLSFDITATGLAGLGACCQLTRLCLAQDQLQLSASSTSGISQLTALQQLECWGAVLEPALLAELPRLRHISLESCSLQPRGGAGVAALLRALAAHTALEHLALSGSLQALAPAPGAYSALTASTALTELVLSGHELPPGCGRHLFPPGRRLPRLERLRFMDGDEFWDWWPPGAGEAAAPLLGDGDVARLVACCPGLVDLMATPDVAASLPVVELAKLSALTGLQLAGPLLDDAVAQQLAAAQLPSLRSLKVHHAAGFTDLGLLALTGLTALAWLDVWGCGLSSVVTETGDLELSSTAEHPLWQQLKQLCRGSVACLAAELAQCNQQLAERDRQLAQREQQLAQRDRQLAELHARLAAAEARVCAVCAHSWAGGDGRC